MKPTADNLPGPFELEPMEAEVVYGPLDDVSASPTAELAALAAQWSEETAHLSSLHQMVAHPAYQRVIGYGRAALPFLFEQLRQAPNHWFWALRSITGEDPVAESDRGNVPAMTAAWLEWAQARGYA